MTRRAQTTLAPEVWARIDALNLVPRGAGMTETERRALTVKLLIPSGLEEEETRFAADPASNAAQRQRVGVR